MVYVTKISTFNMYHTCRDRTKQCYLLHCAGANSRMELFAAGVCPGVRTVVPWIRNVGLVSPQGVCVQCSMKAKRTQIPKTKMHGATGLLTKRGLPTACWGGKHLSKYVLSGMKAKRGQGTYNNKKNHAAGFFLFIEKKMLPTACWGRNILSRTRASNPGRIKN